eukprot:3193366-Rhodomonas_salina.2
MVLPGLSRALPCACWHCHGPPSYLPTPLYPICLRPSPLSAYAPICLRPSFVPSYIVVASYAISGTDPAYGGSILRACYVFSGTDTAYGATRMEQRMR